MEIFKFIFSNFWIFLGVLILVSTVLNFIIRLIVAIRIKNLEELKKEKKKLDKDSKQIL